MRKVEIKVDVDTGKSVKDIEDVAEEVKKVGEEIEDVSEGSKKLGENLEKAGKDGKKGLNKISVGFGSIVKASGIIFIISQAFSALKEILEKQQPVLDLLDTAMTAIGLTITTVSKTLKTIHERVTESTESFDAMGKVFSNVGTIIKNLVMIVLTPFRISLIEMKTTFSALQLGWEMLFGNDESIAAARQNVKDTALEFVELKNSLVESVEEIAKAGIAIGENIGEAIDEVKSIATVVGEEFGKISAKQILASASATTQLKNDALIAEAINKGKFEAYDREAELLRQIRDDTTKTINERISANDKLAEVLNEQERIMLANAAIGVAAAAAELSANSTTENRVALINAKNEQEAISADIAGRRSEQLINEIGLDNEKNESENALNESRKERAENLIGLELELKRARIEAGLEDPNATLSEKQIAFEAKMSLEEEQYIIEQELIQQRFDDKLILDEEKNALLAELEFNHGQTVNKITEDSNKASTENDKTTQDTKDSIRDAGINNALGAISLLASLDEDNKALQAASIVATNAAGIAKMIIANNAANVGALATPQAIASSGVSAIPVIAMNNIATGIGVAASVAATAKGLAKLGKSGGGGGASVPRSSSPSISSPNSNASQSGLTTDTIGTSQQTNGVGSEVLGTEIGQNQIIKAYVVESDITEAQNNINNIEALSEIG